MNYDAIRIGNYPHALVMYGPGCTVEEITPFASYEAALTDLRHRAWAWQQGQDEPPTFDTAMASLDELSDLYKEAHGGEESDYYVDILPLERPEPAQMLVLEWPDEA